MSIGNRVKDRVETCKNILYTHGCIYANLYKYECMYVIKEIIVMNVRFSGYNIGRRGKS